MTYLHSTTPDKKPQSKKVRKAAKVARQLTHDLVDMDDRQLADMAARCQAAGEWDAFELVRRWCQLSLDERHGVAAYFAKKSKK